IVTENTSTANVKNSSAAKAMPSNLIKRAFSSAASRESSSRRVRNSPTRLLATPDNEFRKLIGMRPGRLVKAGPRPLSASDHQTEQQPGQASHANGLPRVVVHVIIGRASSLAAPLDHR